MLCKVCEQLFTGTYWEHLESDKLEDPENPRPVFADHHTTLNSLRAAASEFCFVCHRIWKALQKRVPTIEQYAAGRPDLPCTVVHALSGRGDIVHNIGISLSEKWREHLPVDTRYPPEQFLRLEGFEVRPTPGGDQTSRYEAVSLSTGSESCRSLARKWVDDCIQTHPRCEQLRQSD